jgi:hypothetical protein
MNIVRFMAAIGAACWIFAVTTADAQQGASSQTAQNATTPSPAVEAGRAAPPRCDANCVRENAAKAAEACAPRIEAQAPQDFDWITRPNPGIFQQADPSSPSDAIVRYRGDSVRFMAADKTWTRVSYECGFDVGSKTVSYVQVRSGRLDQPLAPVAEPKTPMVQAAASPAVNAPVAPPGAARPPRPRVGEPSPIVIQQQPFNPKPH